MDQLFWLTTLIPGFAALQAFFRQDIRQGLLGTLTWSFVLTMALVSPLVIIAHLFGLTIQTVGYLYLGLVSISIAGIAKFSHWPTIRRSLRVVPLPEILVILLMVAVTVPFGGGVQWDHQMHSAKILYIRDNGFSLQDPYSPLKVMESKFHVNTYHAVYAVGSWLGGKEPLEMWFRSAWFFRLLAFGGLEFLAVAVFRAWWVGAIVMLGALWYVGPNGGITTPQSIGALVVFPILLAHILDLLNRRRKLGYLKVGVSSLVLGVIHVAYWGIVVICVIPTLIGWFIWHNKQRESMGVGIFAIVALLPGIPFLLITAMQPNYAMEQMGSEFLMVLQTVSIGNHLTLHMLKPQSFLWMLPTASTIMLLLTLRRQTRAIDAVIASIFLTSVLYMFNPFFFEVMMKWLPYWIIRRAHLIGVVMAFLAIPGVLAWILRDSLQTRRNRAVLAFIVICAGFTLFKPQIKGYFVQGPQKEQMVLRQAQELRETFRSIMVERALVAADPEMSLLLPAVQVSSVMAPQLGNANPADKDVMKRWKDCQEFFAPHTSVGRRKEIASTYGIKFALIRKNRLDRGGDFRELGELVAERDWFNVFRLYH